MPALQQERQMEDDAARARQEHGIADQGDGRIIPQSQHFPVRLTAGPKGPVPGVAGNRRRQQLQSGESQAGSVLFSPKGQKGQDKQSQGQKPNRTICTDQSIWFLKIGSAACFIGPSSLLR